MNKQYEVEVQEKFSDANQLDKRIPPSLLMKYQGKTYILKAGLEWKASHLFGGGNYGITTNIITREFEKNDKGQAGRMNYVLAKAVFRTKDGMEFSNFGEASFDNVPNTNMRKYLLHLAVTRAECRVLRMATACGYMSSDEMGISENEESDAKEIPSSEQDQEKPTALQMDTLKKYGIKEKPKTFKEAKEMLAKAMEDKK